MTWPLEGPQPCATFACSSTASPASKSDICNAGSDAPCNAKDTRRSNRVLLSNRSNVVATQQPPLNTLANSHAPSLLTPHSGLFSSTWLRTSAMLTSARKRCTCEVGPAAAFDNAQAASCRTCGGAASSSKTSLKALKAPAAMTKSVTCSSETPTRVPSKRNAGTGSGFLGSPPLYAHFTTCTSNGCGSGGCGTASPAGPNPADSTCAAREQPSCSSVAASRR
mmetsp:Transcript_27160/g.63301  ORF Transcript_27160/g.63301 Transcript_27160/m.63301 type:complete len:223 (+) Transcript_27160:371-1039(+)